MKSEDQMKIEIIEVGKRVGLPLSEQGSYCHSMRDGDCNWSHCLQIKDNEPHNTGRHCPLDIHDEERGYQ